MVPYTGSKIEMLHLKVKPHRNGRRGASVQFSVVSATSRTIAFPAVHVQFAPPPVHISDVL
jgi:hypothetical protein